MAPAWLISITFFCWLPQLLLADIQTGKFASEWMQEYRAGAARFKAIRRNNDSHSIEAVGTSSAK